MNCVHAPGSCQTDTVLSPLPPPGEVAAGDPLAGRWRVRVARGVDLLFRLVPFRLLPLIRPSATFSRTGRRDTIVSPLPGLVSPLPGLVSPLPSPGEVAAEYPLAGRRRVRGDAGRRLPTLQAGRFALGLATLTLILTTSIGCRRGESTADAPPHPEGEAWFVDQTAVSGVQWVHQRGPVRYWLPEIMGGGAAWLDYDGDGDLDLYLVQGGDHLANEGRGGPANVLYQNVGKGQFQDVTDAAGVGDTHYGMGATVGDYDGDGQFDLYVTNVGPNVLYRNRGDGTFEEVAAAAGVDHPGWGTAAAFVDYDADGHEDLLLVNYIHWSPDREIDCRTGKNVRDYCSPSAYQAPAMDVLYRNRGDGTFEDVTSQVGLNAAYGNGLGLVVADFNADGRLDFYVANDGTPNQLWIQDSPNHFRDDSLLLGCSVNRFGVAEAGMGVAALDVENDGDLDLFMTHLARETNTLYINQDGFFEDRTSVAKLAAPSVSFTGFGLGFADFDHDRQLDLFVANGRVGQDSAELTPGDVFAEPNQLFAGLGGGVFAEQLPQGGTRPTLIENSRAAAFADYDRDGDVDLVIVNNGGPARLLNNQIGNGKPWIRFRVRNSRGRDAIGARVGIDVNGQTQWRVVGRVSGYLTSNEPEVHFGLQDADDVDEVRVIWPDGSLESFGSFASRQVVELRPKKTAP